MMYISNRVCRDFCLTISQKRPSQRANICHIHPSSLSTYLRSSTKDGHTLDQELNRRIVLVASAFAKMAQTMQLNAKLTGSTSVTVYIVCVLSTLKYCRETCCRYSRKVRLLNAFHLGKLWNILAVKWNDCITKSEIPVSSYELTLRYFVNTIFPDWNSFSGCWLEVTEIYIIWGVILWQMWSLITTTPFPGSLQTWYEDHVYEYQNLWEQGKMPFLPETDTESRFDVRENHRLQKAEDIQKRRNTEPTTNDQLFNHIFELCSHDCNSYIAIVRQKWLWNSNPHQSTDSQSFETNIYNQLCKFSHKLKRDYVSVCRSNVFLIIYMGVYT